MKYINVSTMQAIIDFAYSRTVVIENEHVIEIIAGAHYIGFTQLENLCALHIKSMLTPQNCVLLWLQLHKVLYEHPLAEHVKKYILRNFPDIANDSEQLMCLEFERFFEIISDDRLNVQREEPVWQCCVRWIDHDIKARISRISSLLKAIRCGLMTLDFFVQNVKEHPYVINNRDCNEIIVCTLAFMYDLNTINSKEEFFRTPSIAIPRLPHDVAFIIGGWAGGRARSHIEVYDTRADRWTTLPYEDPMGVRAYHGTAAIGHEIYCIGGYDGTVYYNTCTIFDALNKKWDEVYRFHTNFPTIYPIFTSLGLT